MMEKIQLQINGRNEILAPGISIKKILESKKLNPNSVACELNLKIIKRAELDKITLKEGDALEIIRMIGGG